MLSAKIPASVIAGQKINASAAVTLTATKQTTGSVVTALFLSTDSSVDADSIQLLSQARFLKLKSGGRATLNFKIPALPSTVPDAVYHLVARVTDPQGLTSTVASTFTISVAPAQIDLSGAFAKTPVPGKSGKTVLTFSITNAGNTPAVGPLTFSIDSSPDGQLPTAIERTRVTKKINLKPGKSTHITVPAALPAGTYYLLIHLDPDNSFQDVNPGNNSFATSTTVTVG
jgi:uncharacterized cupredoxin-like copper-binding protein